MDISTLSLSAEDVLNKIQKCAQELSSYLEAFPLLYQVLVPDKQETSGFQNEPQSETFFTHPDIIILMLEKFHPISEELSTLYEHVDRLEIECLKNKTKQMEKKLQEIKYALKEEKRLIQEGKHRPLWQYSTCIQYHSKG